MDNVIMNKSGFVSGTLVHTEEGLVPIEQLKVGDKVLSKPADGSGELVYKTVQNTLVTNNTPVVLAVLSVVVDSNLSMKEQLKAQRAINEQKTTKFLVTEDHPFWTENDQWSAIKQKSWRDQFVSKDGIKFEAMSGNNPYRDSVLSTIYRTDQPQKGFIPYGEYDTPTPKGSLIDLITGAEIKNGVTYQSVTDKLYEYDKKWKQRLLEQTPEAEREGAEFFGFRQGEWKDPDNIDWAEGEGPLTMTVYNIEVEDTHTYFVGKQGLWVHE